jgi:hypothetical protein
MNVRDALFLSTVAFLVLAALTLVAGVIVVFLGRANDRARERELAAYRTAGETRIHSALADAVAALERLVARQGEHLKAVERTATLPREPAAQHAPALADSAMAVEAGPVVPRIAQRTADGALSDDQRGKMVSVLMRRPGDVMVVNGIGTEAGRRAAEMRAIFRASGWKVESSVVIDPKIPLLASLSVVLGASEQDVAVREAFAVAGVAVAERRRSPMDRPTTIYVSS